jgi:aspartate/methionine/tyrosine aminotransferase
MTNDFRPFVMERWQSTWENRVEFNLSESGVEPLTLDGLLALADTTSVGDTLLGYGQSNGTDELRTRIAALYTGAGADDVVVCNGSAEANFLAIWELVGPGDEVVILVPTYMQSHGLAENFGARVIEVTLHEALGWQPDPDEIRRAVNDRTRLIVVTNPGNPTGAVLLPEARAAILDAAARSGAWLLADEVYTGAELDGPETESFFGLYERVIATGSLSKAYGLPGLRIGWAVADRRLADSIWARSDYTTISPGDLTDRLARIALHPTTRPLLLQRTRSIIRAGMDTLSAWMTETGGFHWRTPDAGAICFARYEAAIESATLAERLRTEQSVLVVPGAHFNMGPWIRFSLGVDPAHMTPALIRIARTLAP